MNILQKKRQRLLIPCLIAAFVLAGMLFSVGALFLKYRLENARLFSMNAVRERLGVDFSFSALRTDSLRALNIAGLRMTFPVPGLGKGFLEADSLRLYLSLPELLQGRVAVGEADIQGGRLLLEITSRGKRGGDAGGKVVAPFKLFGIVVKGTECAVEVRSDALREPLKITDLDFRIANQAGASLLSGELQADLVLGEGRAAIALAGEYREGGTFDANLDVKEINPQDVKAFVPLPEGSKGELQCEIHVWGNAGKTVMADADLMVGGFKYPGLPIPIENIDASINSLLQYDISTRRLEIRHCAATSALAEITAEGFLDFQQETPEIDLSAVITGIPLDNLVPRMLPESFAKRGKLEISLPDTMEVRLAVTGPLVKPVLTARLRAPRVDIAFAPANKKLPKGNLTLTQGDFQWDGLAAFPSGSANISGGTVISDAYGIQAEDIAGTVTLDQNGVSARPLVAVNSDKAFSGAASYELPSGPLKFTLNGTLADIEKTSLHDAAKYLYIAGDIGVNVSGQYVQGGAINLKASADVTRGMVAYDWWLRKPIGVGATIQELSVAIAPGKKMEITGEAYIEDTHLLGTFLYLPRKGKWLSEHIRLDIPHLEVNSAGKCIHIPYTVTGGSCKDGFYERNATHKTDGDNISTLGGVFDFVSFLPDGGATALTCRDAKVSVKLTTAKGSERLAEMVVHAAEAHVPPFSETWLLPLGSIEPPYADEYTLENVRKHPEDAAKESRPWFYKLSADTISIPPWEGNGMVAKGYSNNRETGFDSFSAAIGSGHIEGRYLQKKENNVILLEGTWESIPAKYIIRHLELPEILEGNTTGAVSYTVDQDDPRTTMHAEGRFECADGHFLADPLRETFRHALSDSFAALHPAALQFNKISSDIRIESDHIYTDNLMMQSSGMTIKGNGVWIMEGDMDYRINIAVTPDMADQIQILRDSFNVEGFRMTQRDIELGFHITGPTFSPTGELAGLPPMGVTLVSGAAEMTGEAMKLLDTPRQMFLSIFRIGGSILGATKTQQQEIKKQREQKRQP